MTEPDNIMTLSELYDLDAEFPSTGIRRYISQEAEQEFIDSFIEDRYPEDYRDDKPLPDNYEDSVTVQVAVLSDGNVYAQATDEQGHGDGTGQWYLVS